MKVLPSCLKIQLASLAGFWMVFSAQVYAALAKVRSMDPSKDKGGELGWFLPDQIALAISNVVVNLSPGVVLAAPIQVPGFEESKVLVQSAVVQPRRAALFKRLSDASVVK